MALFEWDDSKYGVGVEEFDGHHERLVGLINELHDAMKSGEGNDHLVSILDELKEYTEYHFSAEEELMAAEGYDGLEEQEIQHEKFVDRIEEFRSDLEDGKITLTMDVMTFLKEWLSNHIRKTDAEYTDFFHDHGVE